MEEDDILSILNSKQEQHSERGSQEPGSAVPAVNDLLSVTDAAVKALRKPQQPNPSANYAASKKKAPRFESEHEGAPGKSSRSIYPRAQVISPIPAASDASNRSYSSGGHTPATHHNISHSSSNSSTASEILIRSTTIEPACTRNLNTSGSSVSSSGSFHQRVKVSSKRLRQIRSPFENNETTDKADESATHCVPPPLSAIREEKKENQPPPGTDPIMRTKVSHFERKQSAPTSKVHSDPKLYGSKAVETQNQPYQNKSKLVESDRNLRDMSPKGAIGRISPPSFKENKPTLKNCARNIGIKQVQQLPSNVSGSEKGSDDREKGNSNVLCPREPETDLADPSITISGLTKSSHRSRVVVERHTPLKSNREVSANGIEQKSSRQGEEDHGIATDWGEQHGEKIDIVHNGAEKSKEASDEVGDLEIVTVPERIVTVTATTNVSSSSDSHSDSMHSNRSERFTGFPKSHSSVIRQGSPIDGPVQPNKHQLDADVQISQFRLNEKQKLLKHSFFKRQENSGPVKRVVQPKYIGRDEAVKLEGAVQEPSAERGAMTAAAAASASVAATQPFVKAQSELETKMALILERLSVIQSGQTVGVAGEQSGPRVVELERQLADLTHQRLDYLEKMQQQQIDWQAKFYSMAVGSQPYSTVAPPIGGVVHHQEPNKLGDVGIDHHHHHSHEISPSMRDLPRKETDSFINHDAALDQQRSSPIPVVVRRPPSKAFSRTTLEAEKSPSYHQVSTIHRPASSPSGNVERERGASLLDTPAPRKAPPKPTRYGSSSTRRSLTAASQPQETKRSQPPGGQERNYRSGRLLEEILSNHEQENRERRRLSDVTPSRTYSSARLPSPRQPSASIQQANELVQELGQLKHEMKGLLQDTWKWQPNVQPPPAHNGFTAARHQFPHHGPAPIDDYLRVKPPAVLASPYPEGGVGTSISSNKDAVTREMSFSHANAPVQDNYADAEAVLKMVESRKENLEANLETMLRTRQDQQVYSLVDQITQESNVAENIRIKKMVDDYISDMNTEMEKEILDHMLKVEEKQQVAPQSPPEKGSPKKSGPAPKPSRGASRLRGRVQAKVNTGLRRRGKDLEEQKRNIGGARSDQDLAERSKVTGKVMPLTRETKGKENVPSKSRVEPKTYVDEEYLKHVYGKALHQTGRQTQRNPYLRLHSTPSKPKQAWPQVTEQTTGKERKSAKTQTTPRVDPTLHKGMVDGMATTEEQYFFNPAARSALQSQGPASAPVEGQLIPMAVPLCAPRQERGVHVPYPVTIPHTPLTSSTPLVQAQPQAQTQTHPTSQTFNQTPNISNTPQTQAQSQREPQTQTQPKPAFHTFNQTPIISNTPQNKPQPQTGPQSLPQQYSQAPSPMHGNIGANQDGRFLAQNSSPQHRNVRMLNVQSEIERATEEKLEKMTVMNLPNIDIDTAPATPASSEASHISIEAPKGGNEEEDEGEGHSSFRNYVAVKDTLLKQPPEAEDSSEDELPNPGFSLPGYSAATRPYHGPAFPPTAPSSGGLQYQQPPSQQVMPSSDVLAADLRRRDLLENRALQWVEQELMARIITEMSRGQATLTERQRAQRNIPETAESETSSLDESVSSAPMGALGQDGLQLFVSAGQPVSEDLVQALLREALEERIAGVLGRRTGTQDEQIPPASPAQTVVPETPAARSSQKVVYSPVPTPERTPRASPVHTPPAGAGSPPHTPIATPAPSDLESETESAADMSSMVKQIHEVTKEKDVKDLSPEPESFPVRVTPKRHVPTPPTTPPPSPPRVGTPTSPIPPSPAAPTPAPREREPSPSPSPQPWGDPDSPAPEEDPHYALQKPLAPLEPPITFSVAALNIEEPESLVSAPESSPEVVPRKGADSGAPSPPPQPASLDSSSSSSGAPSSTVSETINESISEGQWLMDRSEGELPRSHYSHKGAHSRNRGSTIMEEGEESLASTLHDTENIQDDLTDVSHSEGEFIHKGHYATIQDPMLALLAKMQQPIKKLPSQQSANQVPVSLELEGERSLGEVLIGQSERTKHTARMGIPYARELIAPSGTNEEDFVSPGELSNGSGPMKLADLAGQPSEGEVLMVKSSAHTPKGRTPSEQRQSTHSQSAQEQVLSVSDHPHESEVRIQIPVAKPRVIQVGRPESPNTPRAQGIQPKPFVPPPPEGVNRDMMNTLGSSHNSQGFPTMSDYDSRTRTPDQMNIEAILQSGAYLNQSFSQSEGGFTGEVSGRFTRTLESVDENNQSGVFMGTLDHIPDLGQSGQFESPPLGGATEKQAAQQAPQMASSGPLRMNVTIPTFQDGESDDESIEDVSEISAISTGET